MKYRAVIFDLDGTLVDTLGDLAESVNSGLRRLGLPTHSVESYKQRVGNGTRAMISRALPPDRQEDVESLMQMQKTHYQQHFADQSRPYPGVTDMLRDLKDRGYQLAVLSNKPDAFTQKVVAAVLDSAFFDIVRGHRDPLPLKPAPASARAVAQELGLSAHQIAYVGDSGVDMQTAGNAGFFAIGVAWGFRDRGELVENGAAAMIDHPSQLPALLEVERGSLD